MSKSIFEEYQGKWCVVDAGSVKFIGRAVESEQNDFFGQPQMTLQPFFEYMNQKVPSQDGRLSRMELAIPYENIASLEGQIELVNIVSVMWFDKMSTSDRATYVKITEQASVIVDSIRADRAGIKLSSTMPQQKGGGRIQL